MHLRTGPLHYSAQRELDWVGVCAHCSWVQSDAHWTAVCAIHRVHAQVAQYHNACSQHPAPPQSMAEVAIASVEAVFDWKKYLQDTFGYEVDESWMKDDASAEPED